MIKKLTHGDRSSLDVRLLYGLFAFGLIGIPALYFSGVISIEMVNMLGRYLTFAMMAVALDLIWGYTGILSLCQAFFFSLGGYAMGMYLAHHGGPEGIIDTNGWKIPACLYVVYPYKIGEAPADALTPWFWKPFWTLPGTLFFGMLLPAIVAGLIGFFGFRSRVRGVYFAILTQAITVAAVNFFSMNNMKLGGTNGLTRFEYIAGSFHLSDPNVKLTLYLCTLVALIGSYALCRYIVNSPLGRILVAVRDNESALRFYGYAPHTYKMFAYVVAGTITGLAGMLYTPQMGIFTPHNMEASASILVVVWVAVGGRGTLTGPIIGALFVNILYNYLTSERDMVFFTWKAEYWQFVLGVLFVSVAVYFNEGLASLLPGRKTRTKNAEPFVAEEGSR
ncbi:MAG: urea ABC transporter permease subunit UrtC [Candidatus Hydrogenedentota bacterium]